VEVIKGHRGWEALSDPELLALARLERRAFVTNNLVDFRPLHHEAIEPGGPGHFGMVFIPGDYRRTSADVGRIVAALEAKLAAFSRRKRSRRRGDLALDGASGRRSRHDLKHAQ